MSSKLLLIGGGGHCKSVLDSLLELQKFSEIKIIDRKENIGSSVLSVPVIGSDDDLRDLFARGYSYAFVTVGSIGSPALRIKLFDLLCEIGYKIPTVIDPSAKVSKHSTIGIGVFVGKLCIVNAGASIEKGAIINSGAIIEHDCQIGAFSHIAPGAVLGGEVFVGENSHIGSNASVKQQVHIGSNSIIGMGSVVLNNIEDNSLAYGNPCKEVKKL